jgi:hypothetical protein
MVRSFSGPLPIRMLMKIFFILSFLFVMSAMAQNEQYELKGSLGINVSTKNNIEFSIKWNEKEGIVSGSYTDNFYTNSAAVKGVSGELGRIFIVTLPEEAKGVRTISFLGPDLKGMKGSALIPISVVLRDENGKPVSASTIEANLIGRTEKMVAQKQEEAKCHEGFGELAGYCGVYTGMFSEELDSNKKCNLLAFSATRLVLDENGELGLILGETSAIVSTPFHRIGRIFTNTDSERIDVLSRDCRALPGTTFGGDNCKRMNLSGTFSKIRNIKHFSGDYLIIDEKTNERCRYNLSMDQVI